MASNNLSDSIRDLRSRLSLSQEELAARLNVSFATVNRLENGKGEPQGTTLRSLNNLFEEVGEEPRVPRDLTDLTGPEHPRRRKRGTSRSAVLSTKSMEQMLWDCACDIRGEKDAPKFKDYILPLIFIKRLSDVFEDEIARLAAEFGDEETARTVLEADPSLVRFYIPPEAAWRVVSGRKKFDWPEDRRPKTLGEQLTTTIRAIARANTSLQGVIDI